ncbi:MAG: hypothetical protein ACRDTV_14115, partial [Mycobacterium sp.]
MLTVVHDVDSANDNDDGGAGRSLLDEIVRDGARQMLAAALQAEVAAYIDAHAHLVDEAGHRLVVRNGHHDERTVQGGDAPGPSGKMSVTTPPARASS